MTSDDTLDRLSAQPLDAADGLILGRLRRAFDARDPMPADLAERMKFVMTVAALEAEVARIVATPAAAVRSAAYERATTVTFAAERMTVMVTLEEGGSAGVTVAGWVAGPAVEVELRTTSGSRLVRADAEGRFAFDAVARGVVHFVLRDLEHPDTPPVVTPGVEL